jgi:hypothetical protein
MPFFNAVQLATQGRAGVGRSGLERSGCLGYVNVIVVLNNNTGSPIQTSILMNSLHISYALNDQPDTCTFTMEPGSTAPTVGMPLSVYLGAQNNPIFGGQVMKVTHKRRVMPGTRQAPFIDVECSDWTPLLDRKLVLRNYSGYTATDIALDIINTYGESEFTTANVATGLPTINYFVLTYEKPSAALRRLVNLMGGGGWYIDPLRDVHFFPATGEAGIGAPTNPQTLTNTLSSLKSFTHTYDFSQLRNQIIVEGSQTTSLTTIPAGAVTWFPVQDASKFTITGGTLRIGRMQITYTAANSTQTSNGGGSSLAADVAIGATTITLVSTALFSPAGGWVQVGDQFISFGTTSGATLIGIPASGLGSFVGTVKTGVSVTIVNYIQCIGAVFADAVQPGDPVIQYESGGDGTSQSNLVTLEGGDGYHEYLVQDGRITSSGLNDRVVQELTQFAASTGLLSVDYDSDDMNQNVGCQQVINFTTTDALSATLTITHVDLTFPVPNRRPMRHVQATDVPLAQIADITQTETA